MQTLERYRNAEKRLWRHYGVSPTEQFVYLPKLNIQVRVLEIGQGEPVLFVHGSPNAGSKWAPLAAKLTNLRQIEPPTMYLWGAADPFGGVEIGEQCAAAQPYAVLKPFPGSGHLPWLDDPQTHARLVSSFLFD